MGPGPDKGLGPKQAARTVQQRLGGQELGVCKEPQGQCGWTRAPPGERKDPVGGLREAGKAAGRGCLWTREHCPDSRHILKVMSMDLLKDQVRV